MTRPSQPEMTDVLVWELVNVRVALASPVAEDECRRLRAREKSLVGTLLDIGVLSHEAIAPLPPVSEQALQPLY